MKHTAGPWHFDDHENRIHTTAGRSILDMIPRSEHFSTEERDANARLIAASPDLLAALEAILDRGMGVQNVEAAKAALKKARGEPA